MLRVFYEIVDRLSLFHKHIHGYRPKHLQYLSLRVVHSSISAEQTQDKPQEEQTEQQQAAE